MTQHCKTNQLERGTERYSATMAENLFLRQTKWARDIARAFASAEQASPEQRLVVFLGRLTVDTLRLAGAETDEGGEATSYAAVCLRALFTDSAASDEELYRRHCRARVMLILEFLQRHDYLRVDYGDVLDPLASEAAIKIIGTWPRFHLQ